MCVCVCVCVCVFVIASSQICNSSIHELYVNSWARLAWLPQQRYSTPVPLFFSDTEHSQLHTLIVCNQLGATGLVLTATLYIQHTCSVDYINVTDHELFRTFM